MFGLMNGFVNRTICGTPNYIAPEILEQQKYSFEVDVWSIGVVMYTLLVGYPPFETSSVKDTYEKIKKNSYSFPDEKVYVSPLAKGLITKMLDANPDMRPTLKEISRDPWFSSNIIPTALPSSIFQTPYIPSPTSSISSSSSSSIPSTLFTAPFPSVTKTSSNGHIASHNNKENAPPSSSNINTAPTVAPTAVACHPAAPVKAARAPLTSSTTGSTASTFGNNGIDSASTATKRLRTMPPSVHIPAPSTAPSGATTTTIPSSQTTSSIQPSSSSTTPVVITPPAAAAAGNEAAAAAEGGVQGSEAAHDNEAGRAELRRIHHAIEQSFCVATSVAAGPSAAATVPPPTARVPSLPSSSSNMPAPEPRSPSVWINKWVDYSGKYGVGYLLSNGNPGVYFNDGTRCVLHPSSKRWEYMTANGGRHSFNLNAEPVERELKKKVTS
jgi:hypothetical protein